MKNIIRFICFLGTLTISQQILANDNYRGKFWLNLGSGAQAGTSDDFNNIGLSAEISANYMLTSHQLLTLRMAGSGGFLSPDNNSLGLLYGLVAKNKLGYISASAGVSVEEFRDSGGFFSSIGFDHLYNHFRHSDLGQRLEEAGLSLDELRERGGLFSNLGTGAVTRTAGIPIQIQSFITPSKFVGFGTIVTGTYVPRFDHTSLSVHFAIQIGNLR